MLSHSWVSGAIAQMLFALPRLTVADLSAGNWTAAVGHSSEALQLGASTRDAALQLRDVDPPRQRTPGVLAGNSRADRRINAYGWLRSRRSKPGKITGATPGRIRRRLMGVKGRVCHQARGSHDHRRHPVGPPHNRPRQALKGIALQWVPRAPYDEPTQ